jgi:hypothetical protein
VIKHIWQTEAQLIKKKKKYLEQLSKDKIRVIWIYIYILHRILLNFNSTFTYKIQKRMLNIITLLV